GWSILECLCSTVEVGPCSSGTTMGATNIMSAPEGRLRGMIGRSCTTQATSPIGFCYIQYPGTAAPSSLFGGTWTLMFNSEGVFFRTEGQGASSFGGGVQRDALQQHGHVLQTGRNDSTQYHNTGSSRGHVGA